MGERLTGGPNREPDKPKTSNQEISDGGEAKFQGYLEGMTHSAPEQEGQADKPQLVVSAEGSSSLPPLPDPGFSNGLDTSRPKPHDEQIDVDILDKVDRRRLQLREAQRRWRAGHPEKHHQDFLRWQSSPHGREYMNAYKRTWRQLKKERASLQTNPSQNPKGHPPVDTQHQSMQARPEISEGTEGQPSKKLLEKSQSL